VNRLAAARRTDARTQGALSGLLYTVRVSDLCSPARKCFLFEPRTGTEGMLGGIERREETKKTLLNVTEAGGTVVICQDREWLNQAHTVSKAAKCLISGVLLGRSVWSPDKTLCEGRMHYSAASRIHPTNTRHVCCPVCLTWRCLCWIISRFFVKVRIKMWRCLPWQCVSVSTVCCTLPLRRLAPSQEPLSADTSLRLLSSFYKLLWCRVVCVWPYSLTAFLPLYPFATFAPVSYAIHVCLSACLPVRI